MRTDYFPLETGNAGADLALGHGRHAVPEAEIVIGLVNIMAPSAQRTTETLFRDLLNGLAPRHPFHLRVFAPENDGRRTSTSGQAYESLDALWSPHGDGRPVDALIVTGMESRASRMEDEPVWAQLQKLCDWAAEHTSSAIWSCFSAHAAVYHLDGVRRQRLGAKLSGVFECRKDAGHFMAENLPAQFLVPHSRCNDVAADHLLARDYEILSHSARAGADSFTKQVGTSQFLFLQGHPEYSKLILFGEYCRDVKRFYAGEREDYPNLPENYFDDSIIETFASLKSNDSAFPGCLSQPDFVKSVAQKLQHPWKRPSIQLYANWLAHIAGAKFRSRIPQLAHEH